MAAPPPTKDSTAPRANENVSSNVTSANKKTDQRQRRVPRFPLAYCTPLPGKSPVQKKKVSTNKVNNTNSLKSTAAELVSRSLRAKTEMKTVKSSQANERQPEPYKPKPSVSRRQLPVKNSSHEVRSSSPQSKQQGQQGSPKMSPSNTKRTSSPTSTRISDRAMRKPSPSNVTGDNNISSPKGKDARDSIAHRGSLARSSPIAKLSGVRKPSPRGNTSPRDLAKTESMAGNRQRFIIDQVFGDKPQFSLFELDKLLHTLGLLDKTEQLGHVDVIQDVLEQWKVGDDIYDSSKVKKTELAIQLLYGSQSLLQFISAST